jgi:hypothetical protein
MHIGALGLLPEAEILIDVFERLDLAAGCSVRGRGGR